MTARPTQLQEDELVLSAKQGSLEAFNRLYEIYFPVVFRRVRYLVPEADVEDVTQEIFIAALRSLRGFRGESKLGTWLRTITNRQVAEYYRRRRPAEAEMDEQLAGPDRPVSSDEAIVLRQAVRRLPMKYQEVLLLRFVEEMPFDEIALQLGCSPEAGKSLFRRAVSALQKHLRNDGR
jgi:RNA polymerase sigma-70 factor (ECF subfamily)